MTEFLPDFKVYPVCKQKLFKNEFYLSSISVDGLGSQCRKCKRNTRAYSRESFHGINEAQYELMLKSQNGVCAICGKLETMKHQSGKLRSLAVDHNHKTCKIRGLLCNRCNIILGQFNDDPRLLEKAAQYLRHHPSNE